MRFLPAAMFAMCVASSAAHAAPNVVVSIKPLHSLVAGVMAGVAEPQLLLNSATTPHEYTLKPSDAKLLADADIVILVGPSLELFLAKPLASLAPKARHIAAADVPGVTTLPARTGGLWEEDAHGHGAEHEHEHEHEPDHDKDHDHEKPAAPTTDGHLWLDPANARAIVSFVATALGEADKENAARYQSNAAQLIERLDALDRDIGALLQPHSTRPFVVLHDAFQYFETRYKLRGAGSITVSADRPPGARRIQEIKDKISKQGVACLFTEPQFEPKIVRMLVDETGAKMGVLDPEGTAIAPGQELYFDLMRGVAKALADCLSAA